MKNKAMELIAKQTDKQLIEQWILIDSKPMSQEVATVRGWLMDEIEKRFPEEFDLWMECCEEDDDIRKFIKVEGVK